MATSSAPTIVQKAPNSSLTYEFTKRKRWADLLITELADSAIFILSSTLKILYCSPAINELLGWKESEVVDRDFTDLIHSEDQRIFRACFEDSLRRRIELLAYIRLKCNSPAVTYPLSLMKDILFEIKGYPRYVSDGDPSSGCQFFFAMAKPYLSRNVAMLNTMMELQLENEHLESKLKDLKSRQHLNSKSYNKSSTGLPTRTHTVVPSQRSPETPSHYYSPSGSDSVSTSVRNAFEGSSGSGIMVPSKGVGEEDLEDGIKKKKIKKQHPSEQYVCVTCGRTDSPEWRKGPLGPKTLCNACGLRWAKQMRKTDDPSEAGAESGAVIMH